jgi:hypothetical protein
MALTLGTFPLGTKLAQTGIFVVCDRAKIWASSAPANTGQEKARKQDILLPKYEVPVASGLRSPRIDRAAFHQSRPQE